MAGDIENPKVGANGVGVWDTSSAASATPRAGAGNPTVGKNALSGVGSASTTVSDFHGGSAASGGGASAGGKDQGSGPPNAPSPDQSLIGRADTSSPSWGTGAANKPSPDQSLVSSKDAPNAPKRESYFGGVEKGVQIQ